MARCGPPVSGKPPVGTVLTHGGGGEFYIDWLTWLSEHLARAGYITLSMNRRDHGSQEGYQNFELAAMDHKYMVDLLVSRGAESVVLTGHSYGTVTVPYYVISNDARVKAIILYAALGYDREGLKKLVGSESEYAPAVAKAKEMANAGRGKESFLMPPLLPGGPARLSAYKTFLNRRGPETKAIPVEIIRKLSDQPILAIRDPADPLPGTVPPAQQLLQAANKNLEYILLRDIRAGKMDVAAHRFAGREEEVLRITLEWLRKHKLNP